MATKKAVATKGRGGRAPQRKKSGKGAAIGLTVAILISIAMILTATLICLKSIGVIGGGKKLEPKPIPVTTPAPAVSTSSPLDGATAKILSVQADEDIMTHEAGSWVNCPDCRSSSEYKETTSATCTSGSRTWYYCDYCDSDFYVETSSPLGHTSPVAGERKAPTCTETGYQVNKCSRCDTELSRDTLNALGHNPVAGERKEPTCTETGYQVYNCSRCNTETGRDTLQAVSHDLSKIVEDVEMYKIYQCTTCNLHVVSFNKTPEKEGHTFAGWFYGTGENCGESCRAYVGEAFYADTDFHAHFTINTITVTYISDGEEYSSEYIDWNTTATPPTPEKTGYNFAGWYLSDGTKYEGQAITENTTLTAQWTIIRLTINFYVGGTLYTSIEVDYGTAMETLATEAEAMYLNIISAMDEAGEELELTGAAKSSVHIEAARMSTLMSVATFVKLNWYWGIVFALGLIGLAVSVTLVTTNGKKRAATR